MPIKINKENISVILGVFAILLAIHFYIQSKSKTSIALLTNPTRTTLVENNSLEQSKIKIYYDSTLIKGNLHSLYFYLYNNGGEKILEDQFREPIQLSFNTNIRIHEIRLIKISHAKIGFQVFQNTNNTIQVRFKELYPNDGITAQLFFEGEKESPLVGQANIAGIDRISNKPISSYTYYLFITLIFLIMLVFFVLSMKLKQNNMAREDKYRMKELKEKYTDEEITEMFKSSNLFNNKIFSKIMIVVGLIILVTIVISFFYVSNHIIDNFIIKNPEWFVPDNLKL